MGQRTAEVGWKLARRRRRVRSTNARERCRVGTPEGSYGTRNRQIAPLVLDARRWLTRGLTAAGWRRLWRACDTAATNAMQRVSPGAARGRGHSTFEGWKKRCSRTSVARPGSRHSWSLSLTSQLTSVPILNVVDIPIILEVEEQSFPSGIGDVLDVLDVSVRVRGLDPRSARITKLGLSALAIIPPVPKILAAEIDDLTACRPPLASISSKHGSSANCTHGGCPRAADAAVPYRADQFWFFQPCPELRSPSLTVCNFPAKVRGVWSPASRSCFTFFSMLAVLEDPPCEDVSSFSSCS